MTVRPTPFDLVFGDIAESRFPPLERGIRQAGYDPKSREAFTLVKEAVELLRELVPEEGLGAGIDDFVAFVHAAFAFWLDGRPIVQLDRETLDRVVHESALPAAPRPANEASGRTYYLQLPPQRVWGQPRDASPPEPLDGSFTIPGSEIAMVAVFGLYPGRDGFTVAQARGPRPANLARADRTPLFSSRFEAGGADLFSLTGTEELLELGYRCDGLLGSPGAEPGIQQLALG
jgi:hypothetical protein